MKTLEGKMGSFTNALTNTGLRQFFADSQNTLVEWVKNTGNCTDNLLNTSNYQLQTARKQSQSQEVIQDWLVYYLSKLLLVNHSEVDIHLPFEYYGITSLEALRLIYAIEVWLGRKLSLNLVYEYPTVEVLAQHLANNVECVYVS